jgi:hypothetical protein
MKIGAIVKKLGRFLECYGLGLSWLICCWWMWQAYLRAPEVRLDYGHNRPSDYIDNVIMGLVELAVLYLLLNPWYNRWIMARIFLMFLLFSVWTFLFAVVSMHAGNIFATHWFWLVMVDAALFIGFFLKNIQLTLQNRD